MTKLLQCLREELVRRDYAAPTIRSYIEIVEAFRQHTGARLDRLTPAPRGDRMLFGRSVKVIILYEALTTYRQIFTGSRASKARLRPHGHGNHDR